MIPPFLALFSFPLVAIALFSWLSRRHAIVWTLLLGYLFLPATINWNLPLLPPISKETVSPVSILLCLLIFRSKAAMTQESAGLKGWLPGNKLIRTLFFSSFAGVFLTIFTNRDPQRFGDLILPAQRPYDAFSAMLTTLVLLLPMLIARKYLSSEDSHRLILKALALAGLIYSLPIMYELIMSPQVSNQVYGFFPHSWGQHIRNGGYRPVVFLEHGLWLGTFMCCTVLAALAYARNPEIGARKYILIGGWLFVILMLSNTLGAFAIALLIAPLIFLLSGRLHLIGAAIVAGCVLTYPMLRGAHLIPVDQAVEVAASISEKRAGSLQHRFNNEDQLLERANLRPLFGWGGWSRARIFNEEGQDISTTDGLWIIQIGKWGWVGYVALFGLLCGPVLIFAARARKLDIGPGTIGLCIVLAANLVDLIPNASMSLITWMIGGALIGRLEYQHAKQSEETRTPAIPEPAQSRYSRFPPKPTLSRPGRGIRTSSKHAI